MLSAGRLSSIIAASCKQWFDKRRQAINPLLFLGAAICAPLSTLIFKLLADIYTWQGACLVTAGILLNCLTVPFRILTKVKIFQS